MANKVGIISPIIGSPTSEQTTKNSLLRAPKGPRTRTPGTGVWFVGPDKELSGKYRTGLDEDAGYIKSITDENDRNAEIEKVKSLRQELEKALGVDLGPYSDFWNHGKKTSEYDIKHVSSVKLGDQDNIFDLNDPTQKLNFIWLSVSRRIASSLEAYRRGDFSGAQFYVVNKAVEHELAFSRKKEINKAIVLLDDMTPDKMIKVGRLMGLPVSDNSKQAEVYTLIDDALKITEFRTGEHKGSNPVTIFTKFAKMKDDELVIKDLAKQLILNNVIRRREDGLYRGEAKIASNQEELIKILRDEDKQELRLSLEQQLKSKKIAYA